MSECEDGVAAMEIGMIVTCKETKITGTIFDKEWENGWQYTIVTEEGQFFYRSSTEIILRG